ncbi:hypothetical protein CSUB01_09915 [Colletotrichum sublineola]|uniref:Lysr family regulatory protein n=1 Tax=Colletotrichum sublineola TaxID=1173701 RepID=A0A066XZM5_COLSU|nr:hypothetical protein CSUB01_09915 [Colletotrichum sublineola]
MPSLRPLLNPILGPALRQPERVSTDTVIQLSALDRSWMMRMMIMSWSMCFHDVLDPEMLHASLSQLLTIGNWRKLGGRPRLADDGKLELHIPEAFSPSRPAVHFTTEPNPSSVMSHPLASTIPSLFSHSTDALSRPHILDTPLTLTPILAGPEAPTMFSDYTTTDRPLISLHVITFNDATFVTITYPHSATDGMGRKELVENWCRVLAASCLQSLRQSAEADISQSPEAAIRLSDSDILTTWLVRLACSHIPKSSPTKPIAISTALDLRGRLHEEDMPTDVAYVSNLVAYNWTSTTAREFLHGLFGKAAVLIRDSVRSQLTDAQVYASTRLTYNAVAESGSTNQFTEPNGFVVSVSNVSKARFHEVIEFSPAIVKAEARDVEEERTPPRGRIVWQCNTPRMRMHPPCLVYIQGKDHAGNYLAQMLVAEKTWRVIEETISAM